MVPHETLVFNGVATTVREKIIIKITASAECKFGGCIPIASSAGSHTYTIDIGTIEPAKLISVSKWNLWSLF